MGVSSNSHGKKSDKECQSPMLKIFKDIMQKEKHDPEKTNLLLNKKDERKKKYFNTRNKPDRRSRESSSSDQRKRNNQYKTSLVEQRTDFDECRTQSIPTFQNEKRDSWFFWGDTEKTAAQPTEDTCSCVSCALKKIVSSEYACVGCLLVILTISIVAAFLVVCKNVPTLIANEVPSADRDRTSDSERLKRKIDMLNNRRKGFDDESHWKETSVQMNGLSEIAGSEFGPSFRELDSIDTDSKFTGSLNNILDNDKMSELQSSERLRDFYRKLMQTDSQIRNLKKTYGDSVSNTEVMKATDRFKRSLQYYNHYKKNPKDFNENKSINKTNKVSPMRMKLKGKRHRFKRNNTREPMGFVIEKKKVLIKYKPTHLRKVAKCSHTPKDSNGHEKQLNHPFHKNTERLDELLDTLLTKNLPDIMSDPFGLDKLFKADTEKAKHTKSNIEPQKVEPLNNQKSFKEEKYSNSDIMKILNPVLTTDRQKDLYKEETSSLIKDKTIQQKATTKGEYDVLLSVATILNPSVKYIARTPPTIPPMNMVPNIRRLMQLESDDDENLGYEDLKEVLADDLDNHDEFDRSSHERKKRVDESQLQIEGHKKLYSIDVHNPNWKGPMLLYPDELNTVVKQAAVNSNKVAIPINTKDIKSEIDKTEKDLNDLEYVEDYLNNKYEKLVEMAQAYSDYGVLDGKKVEKEKNSAADEKTEPRVTFSVDSAVLKRGLLQRSNKNTLDTYNTDPSEMMMDIMGTYTKSEPSEGIRFELRPTSKAREDMLKLTKMLEHHLKIAHEEEIQALNRTTPSFDDVSANPFLEMIYNTKNYDRSKLESEKSKKSYTIKNTKTTTGNNVAFPFGFAKRALLSVDSERDRDIEPTTTAKYVSKSTDDKYYEVTTMYEVTDINNNDDFEAYSTTVVYKKFAFINNDIPIGTEKNCNTSYKNQNTVNKINITAIKINKTDLHNAYSTVSNKISKFNSTENIKTGVLSKDKHNKSKTDHRVDKLNCTLKPSRLASVNDTKTIENSSQFQLFLVSDDDDENEDDYLDSYSFPLVLYFNENTNDNKSGNMEIKIMKSKEHSEIKLNNVTLNKRDVMNTAELYTEDTSKLESNNDTVTEFNEKFHKIDGINKTTHYTNETNKNKNYIHNNDNINNSGVLDNIKKTISVSDFFMSMSEWFAALEGIDLQPKHNSSANSTELFNKSNNESSSNDTSYPMYDTEMIDNIGHRSRVLLSVNNPDNVTEKRETDDANVSGVKSADVDKSEPNLLNTSIPTKDNITEKKDANAIIDGRDKIVNINKNRTIVKRNADESNLIFWNDIYDDEYGVETERLDDAVRDKHSVVKDGFMKKSGTWMQQKMKQLAQNLQKSPQTKTEVTPTKIIPRETQESGTDTPKYVYDKIHNKIIKRQAENEEDDYDSNQKAIFAAMTNNMKEVCKKAAKAVQRTRNIEVREESKQETLASSLMQQLVRLMNDLVDYQVQQKTCAKLPPDLQNFLEWLTSPEDERSDSTQKVTYKSSYQDDVIGDMDLGTDDKSINHESLLFTNENNDVDIGEVDSKTEYLGTLHDVQELLQQYEAMTDEDKSKMTGVKKYLEEQLDYLNKRISGNNDYNFYNTETAPYRLRRDLTPHRRFKRRLRKKLHKFIKNFGRKHTQTTVSYNDGIQITDRKRKTEKNSDHTKNHDGNENKDEDTNEIDNEEGIFNENKDSSDTTIVKRNLKDVYYKAIKDAKRFTAVDNLQTKKGRYEGN